MLQDFKLTENIEEAVDVAQEQPLPQHCHRLKPHQLRTIQIALQDKSKRVENETVLFSSTPPRHVNAAIPGV